MRSVRLVVLRRERLPLRMSNSTERKTNTAANSNEAARASHTPGPWKVGEDEPFVYALNNAGTNRFFAGVQAGWLTEGGTNKPTDVRTSHDEIMANARLIAAAPDLLEALEKLLAFHIAAHNHPIHAAARAAIKKARGYE